MGMKPLAALQSQYNMKLKFLQEAQNCHSAAIIDTFYVGGKPNDCAKYEAGNLSIVACRAVKSRGGYDWQADGQMDSRH